MDSGYRFNRLFYAVQFLQEAQRVRELERTLFTTPPPTDAEARRDELRTKVQQLYGQYVNVLGGTPEGQYLGALAREYGLLPRQLRRAEWGKSIGKDSTLMVRSYNCLENAGITTYFEIAKKTEQELLRLKNSGRQVVDDIKAELDLMGLRPGMTDEELYD